MLFPQEEGKAEENMAQKRAVLLEKRMRREKESQQRKMQLEAELEHKKEEARYVVVYFFFTVVNGKAWSSYLITCHIPVQKSFLPSLYFFSLKAEEERIRKEEDKARKEFIKQEYLRRKQLKLMEDMDTVIKPRPASGAKQRRSRPKSIHRDSIDSPKTPVRAATGNHGDDPHSERSSSSHLSDHGPASRSVLCHLRTTASFVTLLLKFCSCFEIENQG